MARSPESRYDSFERRLDDLRVQALNAGIVESPGVRAAGGPLPVPPPQTPEDCGAGYYNLPILKPPVWKWMIAAYFFVGGLAGMAGLLAAASVLKHDWYIVRPAMWIAGIGAIISPILLIWDLGRPMRFLNMLRVIKLQSPMSLGSWILSGFGTCAILGLVLTEWHLANTAGGQTIPIVHGLAIVFIFGTALFGIFLGTYTGALVAVSAIPAWHLHRVLLPIHFGTAGLGSAAGALELLGIHRPALAALGYTAAAVELLVWITLEVRRHGESDRALHEGVSGWTLRGGEVLESLASLALRWMGLPMFAAGAFVLGALITRFGWLAAGRASARSVRAVLDEQTPGHAPA